MAKVHRRVNVVQDYYLTITDEQYKLYLENKQEFWELFDANLYNELELWEEDVLDEWLEVEE